MTVLIATLRTRIGPVLVMSLASFLPVSAGDSMLPERDGVPLERIEERRNYRVDATGYAELHEQIEQRSPRGQSGRPAHGLTEIALESRYELTEGRRDCELSGPRVRLELTTWLPDWQPRREVEFGLTQFWLATLEGLDTHEAGHRDLAIRAAERLASDLKNLPRRGPCRELRRRAGAMQLRAANWLKLQSTAYDQATQNGRSQGAVLPTETPAQALHCVRQGELRPRLSCRGAVLPTFGW